MDFEASCPPVDPLQFSDDLIEVLENVLEEFKGPEFSVTELVRFCLGHKYVLSRADWGFPEGPEGSDDDAIYAQSASMRMGAFIKAIPEEEWAGILEWKSQELAQVHLAIIEAAAVMPFWEGPKFIQSLRDEARWRQVQIDILNRLLPTKGS